MKKISGILAAIILIATIGYLINRNPLITIEKSSEFMECAEIFEHNIVSTLNSENTKITIEGGSVEDFDFEFSVDSDMNFIVEGGFLKSIIGCSVMEYPNGEVLIMKGDNKVLLRIDSSEAVVNKFDKIDMGSLVKKKDNKLYIPFNNIAEYFSYRVDYHIQSQWIDMVKLPGEKMLPDAYDMRDYQRVSNVRDQGRYGTCWAFASLGALETTLLPMDKEEFSTDHMSMCNSYNLDLNKGGEHTMSIAYLAAWQGPVLEKDDPYGDGMSNPNLKAVKHLEEALIINERDYEKIKSAIFRYGAIETSLYTQMEYVDSYSVYYSEENNSYYYDGEEAPNHDVVVVGWDDNYPKEMFTNTPEADGAFICKNSWGDSFGDNGYFYVSYYDKNICNKSVVYTKVGDKDNFDKIYQSDLLGWIGLMGFGKEEGFFANAYTAGVNEQLEAVSFYATDKNTEFEVYVIPEFVDQKSLADRQFVVAGTTKYAGYYTVRFPEAVKLTDNGKFAVAVKIKTPGAVHPIAIEYNADERTANFDITDGEGYISLYGESWHSAEETQNCNVCLKAFTNKIGDNEEDK
ncbi:MAG: lectin like domain-containing protein [Lachnospiraceae bacterium]|nr:lectin like domain-containing protein [Lachnospiraceae bacterium]